MFYLTPHFMTQNNNNYFKKLSQNSKKNVANVLLVRRVC